MDDSSRGAQRRHAAAALTSAAPVWLQSSLPDPPSFLQMRAFMTDRPEVFVMQRGTKRERSERSAQSGAVRSGALRAERSERSARSGTVRVERSERSAQSGAGDKPVAVETRGDVERNGSACMSTAVNTTTIIITIITIIITIITIIIIISSDSAGSLSLGVQSYYSNTSLQPSGV
ncbi:unnamed protein product [Arctogadus glacialis]